MLSIVTKATSPDGHTTEDFMGHQGATMMGAIMGATRVAHPEVDPVEGAEVVEATAVEEVPLT